MPTISEIRPSPIAGRWYEGNPQRLSRQVGRYIDDAHIPELKGDVVALIVPHAGHIYSGATAGYAFRCVRGQTRDLVVIVSPLHAYHFAPLLTSAHQAYQTPLGTVPIDKDAVTQVDEILTKQSALQLTPLAYDEEHSLEIELPFLQCALEGSFNLLPIMMRSQQPETARQVGLALAEVLKGRNALLVASSDLSHFYTQEQANGLDAEMLKQFAAFSPEGVFKAEASGTGFACGMAAVAAVLWAAKELGANTVEVLHHATSADETGDTSSVVGYGAAVVLKS
ncbi:MAG TPA: AmmeMemoRadiSam system protein B [Longilinea sp.]|nr:AmmeMemoRadiSam system protein B [Longilinea sp.]